MQECIFFDAEQMMPDKRGIVAPSGMKNSDAVFAFYCTALSFPEYFGWNWDAFDECIHDLYWIDGTTIHIVHPDIPLNNDLDRRAIMLSSLYEIRFYSRASGKIAVHFKTSDKQEVQSAIVQYYKDRGYFQENLLLSLWRKCRGETGNCTCSVEDALNVISKKMADTYVEMGFLDKSEFVCEKNAL